MSISLNITQVSNRENKFAITAGKSILAKFKTIEDAKASLQSKKDIYIYWAGSASVSVDNSNWKTIVC